jgi:hypothetical protein
MTHIFSACPHDSIHDPDKWAALSNTLAADLDLPLVFEKYTNFHQFELNFNRFDFIYAHPLHAARLSNRHGFIPLAKFDQVFDEAILIASKEVTNPSIKGFALNGVACIDGTPSHAAYLLAASRKGWPFPENPIYKNTYPDVVMSVAEREADYGIVLKSVWEHMADLKDRVVPFQTTDTRELVHIFMLRPTLKDFHKRMTEALAGLSEVEAGKQLLTRLCCERFVPFSDVDLNKLKSALQLCGFKS